MSSVPLSPNEKERIASLHRYAILDTPPEAGFDRIAALAARLFDVPLALVTLVDGDRLWFKSCQGACQDRVPSEVPRDFSLCTCTIHSKSVLVLENACLDPRFSDNPLVTGEFGLRFYAGAPLILADGAAVGALCLVDFEPRTFSQDQRDALTDLAAAVVSEMELRRALSVTAQIEAVHQQMFADSPHSMWVFDAETWRFLDVNAAALALYGYSRAEFLTLSVLDLQLPENRPRIQEHLQNLAVSGSLLGKQGVRENRTKNGTHLWVEVITHSVQFGSRNALMAVAQDVTEHYRTEAALRRSQERFALHVQQTPLAVVELTPDLIVTSWNPAAEVTFGYTRAEAIGQSAVDLIVPTEEQARVEDLRVDILTTSGGARSTNRNRTKSGEIILCDWYNTPLVDENDHTLGIAAFARDITKEAHAQERLRRSEAHKSAILDSALDCIISIDQAGRIIDWNAAAERTFGCPCSEAVGQNISEMILPPPLRPAYRNGLMQYLASGDWPALHARTEMPAQRRNGTQFHAEVTATVLKSESQTLYTIYLRDITERKHMESEREALLAQTESLLADALERADHDPLTGLLNHRAFHKRLKEEMEAAQLGGRTGAVLLLDLNNFKFFNDAYGHLAGDDVLRQIGQTFEAVCRSSDTLARYGGDEFALLLPDASEADAQAIAEDLRAAALLVGYQPPGYETFIPFNLSVGIACFPEDAATRTDLLEAADTRLRVSKTGGDADSHAVMVRRSLARSVGGFTMLDALVTAVDNKDRYTRRHSEDVMRYSLEIADALGLDVEARRVIEVAALLHDVGKIGVPDAILRKPGRLTEEDFEAIKQHPMMGSVIVSAVAGFEETLDAVRHHHERWDGNGYPFGLSGEECPLPARLMAVADAYSAMTTDRPYRKGMDPEKALDILEEGAGTQWDPACIGAFFCRRRPASPLVSHSHC